MLERLLVGDLSLSEAQADLADCHECRSRFAELRALADELGGAGELERAVLSEIARAAAPAGAEERIRGFVRARVTGGVRPRRWIVALAVAAGLLLTVVLWRAFGPERGVDEVTLGEHRIAVIAPVAKTAELGTFSWRYDHLPPLGTYRLRVLADEGPNAGQLLADKKFLKQPQWTFTPDEVRAWPARIRWQVEAQDVTGQGLAQSESQPAWR